MTTVNYFGQMNNTDVGFATGDGL